LIQLVQNVFYDSCLPCSCFSIDENVGASRSFKNWGYDLPKMENLLFSMRQGFRNVIVPQHFPVLENV
jgi:hypothetical protein